MIKASLLFTVLAVFTTAAVAQQPMGGDRGPGNKMGMMENLTVAQQECITAQNCPKMEMPQIQHGQKPDKGQQPKMTDEQKSAMDANRECMKKAMETCGVEMPEMPDRSDRPGNRPERGTAARVVTSR